MALSRYRRDAEHFEVVTPFDWNERHFSEGEAFPAHELGLGEMERRQLWVANKIRCVDAPPAAPVATPPPDGDREPAADAASAPAVELAADVSPPAAESPAATDDRDTAVDAPRSRRRRSGA